MSATLKDIAAALGVSKRGIEIRATRESWPYQAESVRGGQRRVYPLPTLPAEVRKAVETWRVNQERAALIQEHQHGKQNGAVPLQGVRGGHSAGAGGAVGGGDFMGRSAHGTDLAAQPGGGGGVGGEAGGSGAGAGAGALKTGRVPGGDLIPAGFPSLADSVPAATGAGEVTGGDLAVAVGRVNGAMEVVAGMLMAPYSLAPEQISKKALKSHQVITALGPLMAIPPRTRGRKAVAIQVAQALGLNSVQQVYKLEEKYRERGALAFAHGRADRGVKRVLISQDWMDWLGTLPESVDPQAVSEKITQIAKSAWVGGAPSGRQCWLKSTAELARQMGHVLPQHHLVTLLNLPEPRRWMMDLGQQYSVAGRARRDAKAAYDHNITPVQRTAAGLRPGDWVCGDISPLDLPVLRPDGSVAYARMISWYDMASNWWWVDLFLCDAGQGVRREQVAASFARMCEVSPFGAPLRLYLDNGSEYQWESMLENYRQLAELMGQRIAVEFASLLPPAGRVTRKIPFHPRGDRIEGGFGNMRHWLGWHANYVGGNRMTKKVANLGKAPEAADYDQVRGWLADTLSDYHATPQQAEHMRGLSPQQVIDRHLDTGWRPFRINRAVLMLAFADTEERTVTRGALHWDGVVYFADFLMGYEGKVIAKKARVCSPEEDCLFVFSRQEAFLGVAGRERIYAVGDQSGAKEAGRRRSAFKLLMKGKEEEAGGALDETQIAGLRGKLLGVDATVARAQDAAIDVEGSDVMLKMLAARQLLTEETRALFARRDAARDAQQLIRLSQESEEEAAARAMGL